MASTENKARAAKAAAADATKTIAAEKSTAKDPMAAFTFPNFEFPEMMRSFTEQGVNQTREDLRAHEERGGGGDRHAGGQP